MRSDNSDTKATGPPLPPQAGSNSATSNNDTLVTILQSLMSEQDGHQHEHLQRRRQQEEQPLTSFLRNQQPMSNLYSPFPPQNDPLMPPGFITAATRHHEARELMPSLSAPVPTTPESRRTQLLSILGEAMDIMQQPQGSRRSPERRNDSFEKHNHYTKQ